MSEGRQRRADAVIVRAYKNTTLLPSIVKAGSTTPMLSQDSPVERNVRIATKSRRGQM
jgi:hypothetical protein